jgi:hypothetical protein
METGFGSHSHTSAICQKHRSTKWARLGKQWSPRGWQWWRYWSGQLEEFKVHPNLALRQLNSSREHISLKNQESARELLPAHIITRFIWNELFCYFFSFWNAFALKCLHILRLKWLHQEFQQHSELATLRTHGCWVRVAPAYNPSYLGDWEQEEESSRPAWANSL